MYISISILSQSHVLFDLVVGTQKRFGVGWDVVNIILFYINEIFDLCYLLNVITVTAGTIMSVTPYSAYSAGSSSQIGTQYTNLCGYGQDSHSHATYKCDKKIW